MGRKNPNNRSIGLIFVIIDGRSKQINLDPNERINRRNLYSIILTSHECNYSR